MAKVNLFYSEQNPANVKNTGCHGFVRYYAEKTRGVNSVILQSKLKAC